MCVGFYIGAAAVAAFLIVHHATALRRRPTARPAKAAR
jgi:hypothetical protein